MLSARAFTRRFLGDPVAVGAFLIVVAVAAMVLSAPWLAPQNPYDPLQIDLMDAEMPPSWIAGGDERFLLGTDAQGRGVMSTIMYGTGISLLIGFGAVVVQAFIGVSLGLIAGYRGGWIDAFLMRLADIQLSLSTLMLAIIALAVFSAAFGPETYAKLAIFMLIIVIGIAEWPRYARTVRASVLAEKKKEYVDAARVIGLSRSLVMVRHVLPNVMGPVLVIATINLAIAVLGEATLSFLGVGVPPTEPSLGTLIRIGNNFLFSGEWWIVIFPGVTLAALVLSVNLLGDWLRDALNPKLR